jgi:integrase/recombinase XerD
MCGYTLRQYKFTHFEGGSMKQARVITPTELKRLLRLVSTTKHAKRNRLMVMLSYMAGLRACEIATLKVSDVINFVGDDWEVKSEVLLSSEQTKGAKAQTIIINSALQKEISDYFKAHRNKLQRDGYLLVSQKRGGFSSQTIQNLFRELYHAAAIPHASSHSGRRTFITTLSEQGVSVRLIQALARHSNLGTTQKYIDVSSEKLRGAAEHAVLSLNERA